MKNVLIKKVCLFFGILMLLFTSCNIGLGAAVDTVPPQISISMPLADSQIRESFVMSGAWSDDLAIDKVEVVLKNLDTKKEYGPFTAETKLNNNVVTEGSWSCKIEPVADGKTVIPDGVYTATITAYDTYEHKNEATQTFSIDNTCPILTLSSPSTTADIGTSGVTLASFGKIFDIKGEYSDESGVDAIEVTFFDEHGQKINGATTSLKVKGTTIDDSVAVWGAANGLYEKIYGNDATAGTKSFYCTITIYDAARKVPAVEGDKGNACNYFFLTDEITEKYFSDDNAGNFKAKEAYAILSGKSNASDISSYYVTWYSNINSLKKSRASFTINPANNPSFTVSGYTSFIIGGAGVDSNELSKTDGSGTGLYEFRDKNKLNITIKPGLDGYGIKSDSLKLHLIECDEGGNIKYNASGKPENDVVINDANITPNGSSYTIEAPVNSEVNTGIKVGNFYCISVEGVDTKGNKISNGAEVYAIKYMPANTSAPTVKITKLNGVTEKVNTTSISGDDDITVEGTLSYFPDKLKLYAYFGNPDQANPNIQDHNVIYNTSEIESAAYNDPSGSAGFTVVAPNLVNQKNNTTFTLTIPKSKIGSLPVAANEDTFEIHIVAELVNAMVKGSTYFQVQKDTEDPVFEDIYSVTPEVIKTVGGVEKSYVNGTVTLTVNVSDNIDLKPKVEYSLDNGSNWEEITTTKKSIVLDTTNFTDKTAKIIKFRATDKVGNVGKKDITLNVDQSTDMPVVSLSNVYNDVDSLEKIKGSSPKKNIYGKDANNILNGTITDDDGVEKYQIIFDGTPYGFGKYGDGNADFISGGKKTSVSINHNVPTVEGTYDVYIYVEDSKAETSTGNNIFNPSKTEKFATIAVDEGAPNFTITTTSGALQAANTDLPVTGNWFDGTAITIERMTMDTHGEYVHEVDVPAANIKDTNIWSDTIPAETVGTDGGTRYYKATDIYGQSTIQKFIYKVDSLPPEFTVTSVNGVEVNRKGGSAATYECYAKSSGTFIVKGNVYEPDPDAADDENEGSGLDNYIYYYIADGNTKPAPTTANGSYVIDEATWGTAKITPSGRTNFNFTSGKTEASASGEWTATIDISSGYVETENYTLYIVAKDQARNISKIADNPSAKIILKPDSSAPVFNDLDTTTDGIQDMVVSNISVTTATTEDITFTVDVTDARSGVASVKLYRNGVDTGLEPAHTNGTSKYKFTVSKDVSATSILKSGTNSFYVVATDTVGNSGQNSAVVVSVDKDAPKVSIGGVSPSVSQNGNTYYNGKVTVTGVATDETALKEIRYFFRDVTAPYTADSGQVIDAADDGTYKSYDFEIDTRNLTDNTVTKLTVVAVDKAGNFSSKSEKNLSINQTTDKPVINTKAPLNNTTYAVSDIKTGVNLYTTTGSIGAELSDDDGIASVEIYVGDSADPEKTIPLSENPTSYSLNVALSDLGITSVGDYAITIKVIDSALGVSSSTNKINLGIDNGAPTLSIVTTANDEKKKDGIYYVKDDFTITSTVKDDYKLESLTWSENGGVANPLTVTKDATSQNVDKQFTKPASSKKSVYLFEAKDKFNQATKIEQTYIYDLDAPVISNIVYSAEAQSGVYYYNSEKSFTITGKAAESGSSELQSGLNSVEFIVYSGHHVSYAAAQAAVTSETAAIVKDWQSTTGTSSWTAKIDSDSITDEGKYTVFIRATDFAGNSTVSSAVKVIADSAKPAVSITKINDASSSTVNEYYTDSVTIEGTVTETYLKSFTVSATKDGASINTITKNITPKTGAAQTSGIQDWKLTIPATDGDYVITIVSADYLNQPVTTTINTKLDKSAPTFTVTGYTGSKAASPMPTATTSVTCYGNLNDYFTVKGVANDAAANGYTSELEANIYYTISTTEPAKSADESTYDISTWSTLPLKSDGATFEIPVSFADFQENDSCTIYIASKDKAGNVSKIAANPSGKMIVKIDGTAPTVKTPVLTIGDTTTTIKVAAMDGNSLIKSAVLKLDGTEYAPSGTGALTLTSADGSGEDDGYTVYTYTIKNDLAELNVGTNTFTITVTDNAGNSKTSSSIVINNNAPSLSDVVITNADEKNKAGEYVYEKDEFTISGKVSVTGSNKLASVQWEDTYDVADVPTALNSGTYTVTAGNFTATIDPTSSSTTGLTVSYKSYENKKVTRTITAANVYGETATATVKFVTDITAPNFQLNDITAAISGLKINGDSTINLGWYKSTTLPIKGSVLDNGSGVEKVDYQINATSGEFYTSKVTNSGNTYYTFSGTSGAFIEGAGTDINTITFSVTDKAGNTKTLTTIPNIKVDTTAPSVANLEYKYDGDASSKTYESAMLTNKGKNIILSGTFNDDKPGYTVSGVNSVYVKVNGNNYDAVLDSENGTWSAEVVTSDLATEGSYQAQIFVIDNAGNSDGSLNCLFKVDTVAPVVDVESPSDVSALNGNNTFSGTVSELNNLKSIELFYQFAATEISDANLKNFAKWTTTNMKKVVGTDDVQLADISNWKFNTVNVNEYLGTNTSGYLYILPVAYDEAGNESIKESSIETTDYIKYTIDLESDRPTIQFSNLPKYTGTETQFLTHTTTLSGSISDDDGIKEFKIANQAAIPADWSTVENVAESAGSFTYDLGADGEKQLWFYIKDSADGVFVTGGNVAASRNNAVYEPKLVYSSKTAGVADTGDNSTVIEFTTDSNAPVVGDIEYAYGSTSTALTEESTFAALTTGDLAGGTERKYIMIGITATDSGSGLKNPSGAAAGSVVANINGESFNLTKSTTTDYWYTEAIDVSELPSTNYTISISVTDNAGLTQSKSKQLIVDNAAPTASLISPVDEVTGSITLMGTSIESSSTLTVTKYVIGTNTINSVEKALVEARKDTTVCNLQAGSSASGWKFVLDGNALNNPKLPASAETLSAYSDYNSDDIYTLPVYIYTKDSLGNDGITEASIIYNPYGDRPKASLTYPLGKWISASNVEDYSNIAGSMRITGAAEDNAGIGNGRVYIQLDVNNDGKFTVADKAILAAMPEYETVIIDDVDAITDASFTLTDYSVLGDASADFWGIKVNGTNSWNYTIDTNNELQIDSTSLGNSKYKVGIRAVAIDNTGVMGKWSDGSYFMIDLNAPSIGSASVWTNPEDEDEVAASYQDDMFLKGTKYLQLEIKDLTGVKNVKYTYATSLESLSTSGNSGTADIGTPKSVGGFKVYTVNIPISELCDSDHLNSTSLALKVTATKDSDTETTSYEKYNVYFDNTAPAIGGVTLNGMPYDADDAASQKIVNSNGYFTIGGQASDDGAGFERMSFYFMRPAGSTITEARLYDVMIAPEEGKTSKLQPNYVALSGLTKKTITIDDVEFDMYGATQNVTISDASTVVLESADSHIRAGGYVQIGETWHKIGTKAGTTLTLVTETTATGSVSAFFPYMQSIDNTGTEKSNGAGGVSSGDDGDTMPESIIKSQTTWNYDASFFSNYIPDGPGYLVTFVYDKAGNVNAAKYKVSVENNAPRLTKLWLATDLNNSGTFEDEEGTTELIEYNVLAKVGEQTNYKTMKTADYKGSRFIIKNKLAVIPEFTNGNGTIYMAYSNTGAALTLGNYENQTEAIADLYNSDAEKVPDLSDLELARTGDSKWAYVIASADLGAASYNETTGDEDDRAMSFTFWDSTEDTISGVSSNSCYLKITDLVVNVLDKKAPNVVVKPFFWNNHEDNSLYKNSYKNGHIDLPATATEDPKVSGIISIRGSAFDDHSLSSIWVKYDGFTPDTTVYDGAADSDGYYKVASYEDGIWTSYAQTSAVEGNKWNFTVTPDYLGQAGHKVSWQLDIDTSAISGAMGDNKKVYVRALDAAATAHVSSESAKTTSTEDSVYNVPAYQMDVVPYIFEVLDKNKNSANRSRLGRYPVQAGATIYLKGFNFGAGAITVTRHKYDSVTKKASTTAESDTITATRESANLIKITAAPQYSGYINLTIGTSKVQNNLNVNEKWNIQEGYIATEEDTYGAAAAAEKGKNFWTDDVYLSVWNVGGTLTQSLLPVNGTIENFGDATGKIYNGSINFQYVTADRTNTTYGIYGSNAKMIYNGWFQNGATRLSNLNFQANTSYKLPPAEVDTCIVGDKPMYVVLDNGIDGSGTWSSGLYCAIDGWNIPQSANQVKPIEVQGNGANDNPDSSDGMDDILFQFRNPKIAGYKVSNNEYYAYVSYYDSYARCLKYSKFKFTGTGEGDKTPVVAMYGNEKTGIAVVDGYDTLQNNFSGNGWDCGEFSDIKVDGTIPVIAYFSNSSSTANGGSGKVGLRIARGSNTAPKTYRVDGTTTIADYANEWIYTDVPTPAGLSDFGRYVSMEMDNSGGLHIIAQGTSNMTDSYELWYMYLKKASDGKHYEKVVEMKVDATSSVGRYTDIKLGKTNATGLLCYPTVTYMDEAHLTSTRAVKVAYLDNVTSSTVGIWECMTDPASYAATNQKLSIVLNSYDNLATPIKNKLAVGINSDLFVIDCLRNESDDFTTY